MVALLDSFVPARMIDLQNPINRKHPLMRGLVSRWKVVPQWFGSPKWYDLASRNHGTLTNGPTWAGALGRPGAFGSLSFSTPSSQWVSVSPAPVSVLPVTLATWFRPIDTLEASLVQLTDGTGLGYLMEWYTSKIGAQSQGSGEALTSATGATGEWHFATAVFTASNERHVYLDGQNKGSNTTADSGPTVNQLSIGKAFSFSGYVNGHMDDVFVFSRALSDIEVWQLYQATRQERDPTLNWIEDDAILGLLQAAAPGPSAVFNAAWARYAQPIGGGIF